MDDVEAGIRVGERVDVADGWRAWAADPDGWILIPNGEILCRVR